MNLSLGQFQTAFVEALYHRSAPQLAALTGQAAFAVYRNTVLAGCVDALRANFPAVEALVGPAWMQDAAAAYTQCTPPDDPRLIRYGATFADFLEQQQAHHGLPYLADVARLDFAWCEAFSALREPCLDLADLAGMTTTDLACSYLAPRSSVRWYWFAQTPVFSLWRHSREGLAWPQDQPWRAEGALLSGTDEGVVQQALEMGGCAFLDACAQGLTLERASQVAQQAQPDLDFAALLGRLLAAQVFRPLSFA
ncbi:DNA-binding domain-containing protein [Pseudomonas sp.]|uniref:HvfC/BufC N-terminal domain-containing protein n=1 Tax=Pseudomonas sp. TaxID=306 RepID=UPI0027B9C205|nr:DNA-binding domain-containing protein [Pseudomonas sp.]